MQIPDSINLFGLDIKTEYCSTLLADREHFGEYCSRLMTITIDSNLSDQRKALTYCHELIEAITSITHVSTEDTDEQSKQALALGVYQILQQADKFKEEDHG